MLKTKLRTNELGQVRVLAGGMSGRAYGIALSSGHRPTDKSPEGSAVPHATIRFLASYLVRHSTPRRAMSTDRRRENHAASGSRARPAYVALSTQSFAPLCSTHDAFGNFPSQISEHGPEHQSWTGCAGRGAGEERQMRAILLAGGRQLVSAGAPWAVRLTTGELGAAASICCPPGLPACRPAPANAAASRDGSDRSKNSMDNWRSDCAPTVTSSTLSSPNAGTSVLREAPPGCNRVQIAFDGSRFEPHSKPTIATTQEGDARAVWS